MNYTNRALDIMIDHYHNNGLADYIEENPEELSMFWWEGTRGEVDRWVQELRFDNWNEMKNSPNVCKVYNTGSNRILIFADFTTLPKPISMLSLEQFI